MRTHYLSLDRTISLKSISDICDLFPIDPRRIKPARSLLRKVMGKQIIHRRVPDPHGLSVIDSFQRKASRTAGTEFHLDKHEIFSVLRDNVNLALLAAVIPLQDHKSALF